MNSTLFTAYPWTLAMLVLNVIEDPKNELIASRDMRRLPSAQETTFGTLTYEDGHQLAIKVEVGDSGVLQRHQTCCSQKILLIDGLPQAEQEKVVVYKRPSGYGNVYTAWIPLNSQVDSRVWANQLLNLIRDLNGAPAYAL